ncbi:MAG: hypothetical protein U9N49_05930, partial [Campylobacterota bacterium]|nr:hypothetical protein [Campylobacterota bacterium]
YTLSSFHSLSIEKSVLLIVELMQAYRKYHNEIDRFLDDVNMVQKLFGLNDGVKYIYDCAEYDSDNSYLLMDKLLEGRVSSTARYLKELGYYFDLIAKYKLEQDNHFHQRLEFFISTYELKKFKTITPIYKRVVKRFAQRSLFD